MKGYDRAAGTVIVNDSYFGQDIKLLTTTLESLWNPFNHFYMPVYRADREPAVRAILGEDWDQAAMFRRARAAAEAAVKARPKDAYAWFNLGDDSLALDDVAGAIKAYEQAMRLGLPARMLWYRPEPFVAYNRAGQYQRVLDLSAPLLVHITGLAQIYEQRGHAYVGLGQARPGRCRVPPGPAVRPRPDRRPRRAGEAGGWTMTNAELRIRSCRKGTGSGSPSRNS